MGVGLPLAARRWIARARGEIERLGRRAAFGDVPSWRRQANTLPWFDQPDALAQVSRVARVHGLEATMLERWVSDGYVILDDGPSVQTLDDMIAMLDGLWEAADPVPGLTLLDLRPTPESPPRSYEHHELLALSPERRAALRRHSHWRIHGLHYVNDAARRIYHDARLHAVVTAILDRATRPIAAINFMRGSEQHLHQDMAVFHIYPHNHLVGAWIACEDVGPDSGPLVLYRGSHRAPFFVGFDDYPQTNLRTADDAGAAAYHRWVDALAARYERHEFHARKGQVLLWHGMLIHGGAPVRRAGTSRRSMVVHYASRGADRGREVRGPFRW